MVPDPSRFTRDHPDLVAALQERGILEQDRVKHALNATPRAPFLHPAATPLAACDTPAPIVDATRQAAPCPSPRTVATLIQALHLEDGHDVLLVGSGLPWLGALAATLTPSGTVTLHEQDTHVRQRTYDLQAEGSIPEDVRIEDDVRNLPDVIDRVLVIDADLDPSPFLPHLADQGVLVYPEASPHGLDLVRTFHDGTETARLHLGDTTIATQPPGLDPSRTHDGLRVTQLLGAEALQETAWIDHRPSDTVQEIQEATDATIGRAFAERGLRSSRPVDARTAEGAFQAAYVHQRTGEFEEAALAYTASLRILESAEAYTFRGWARSYDGDLEGAIEDCKTAIDVDPALGNAYNDIGAYLLEQGRPREALRWFEDATDADRYTSRHFPYLNLGRTHLRLGNQEQAREALERALELDPGNPPAQRLLRRLQD